MHGRIFEPFANGRDDAFPRGENGVRQFLARDSELFRRPACEHEWDQARGWTFAKRGSHGAPMGGEPVEIDDDNGWRVQLESGDDTRRLEAGAIDGEAGGAEEFAAFSGQLWVPADESNWKRCGQRDIFASWTADWAPLPNASRRPIASPRTRYTTW